MEPIETGAIFFFDTMHDYELFLQVADQFAPLTRTSETSNNQAKSLTFYAEIIRRPAEVTTVELVKLVKNAHARIAPSIEVEKIRDNLFAILYKKVASFEEFSKIFSDNLRVF
jgi:hypothetical protein